MRSAAPWNRSRQFQVRATRLEPAAFIAVLAGLQQAAIEDTVRVAHERCKPNFVERGLMLGEFWSGNDSPGVHNPEFRPLDSPVPLLVIRQNGLD